MPSCRKVYGYKCRPEQLGFNMNNFVRSFELKISAKIRSIAGLLLLSLSSLISPAQHSLNIRCVDCDPLLIVQLSSAKKDFTSRVESEAYARTIPSTLHSKGYPTASLDSLVSDSASTTAIVYLGPAFTWLSVRVDEIEPVLLYQAGWTDNSFEGKIFSFDNLKVGQERMLDYLERNGYPFAKISLDSIKIDEDKVTGILRVDKGPLYRIDSIRVYGNARISNQFLQRYLEIPNGSIYDKQKLLNISRKLSSLPYIREERPADLTMLGTGSVLNLHLSQRRSSQVNALIGFLPNNDQLSSRKMLVTGEANIHLKNALGIGETIGLNWQQLQVKSPRLNLIYQHPFIFNSPLGLDLLFNMFRKDSSYLNINFQLGARYFVSSDKTARLFLQKFQTIISEGGLNTAQIIQSRRLPNIADIGTTTLGLDYDLNATDYRLNPRRGEQLTASISAGIRSIRKNNQVASLKDPSDPSFNFSSLYDTVKLKTYQISSSLAGSKYFPLGKQTVLKTSLNAGLIHSDDLYQNELFQIGGYKLLRGFDEESQYVSQFGIGSVEFRYIIDLNSYFFGFLDGGWGRNRSRGADYDHTYLGTGVGLTLETRNSLFTIAWAIGQRDDLPFNLRQSKIHLAFSSFF